MNRARLDIKLRRINEGLALVGRPPLELDYYRLAGGYDLIVSGTGHHRLNSVRLPAKAMGLLLDGINMGLAWGAAGK